MQVVPLGRTEDRSAERRATCLPFLKALEKPSSVVRPIIDREVRMQDMLEMFRAVRIHLPLVDAIQQVSAYARFLKELCTKKRRSRKESVRRGVLTVVPWDFSSWCVVLRGGFSLHKVVCSKESKERAAATTSSTPVHVHYIHLGLP
ncbi:unnamed protein product [Victoria cruziana]